jgi:hypothetical protein
VNCLENVRKLELSSCNGITNIMLTTVRFLILENCDNIRDISKMDNIRVLHVRYCKRVDDLSTLKSVRELYLSGFLGSDLSALQNIEKLYLFECRSINAIAVLKKLQQLTLYCRLGLLQGLTQLKSLTLGHDWNSLFELPTAEISKLKGLETLTVFDARVQAHSFESWKYLLNIRCLSFERVRFDAQIPSSFIYLQSLKLENCCDLRSLPVLPALRVLVIRYCSSLKELELLGAHLKSPLYSVEIEECCDLQEIEISRKISKMKIIACKQLLLLSVHSQLGYLRTRQCYKLNNVIGRELIGCEDFLSYEDMAEFSQKYLED